MLVAFSTCPSGMAVHTLVAFSSTSMNRKTETSHFEASLFIWVLSAYNNHVPVESGRDRLGRGRQFEKTNYETGKRDLKELGKEVGKKVETETIDGTLMRKG